MDDQSKAQSESSTISPQREPAGYFVVPAEITSKTLKQHETYDKADLDEYCLWLYSIYERIDIELNKRTQCEQGESGMILFKILQEYKWQSNYDFAGPFPLATIRAFEVAS